MLLKPECVSQAQGELLKAHMLGFAPRGSDSVNQVRARESDWLTDAVLTQMLLALGPLLEDHGPCSLVSQVGTMLTTKPGDASLTSPL